MWRWRWRYYFRAVEVVLRYYFERKESGFKCKQGQGNALGIFFWECDAMWLWLWLD